MLRPSSVKASAPISTTTPTRPITTPIPFCGVICSSTKKSTRDQHREQGCTGINNGGETSPDVVLTPNDEGKWDHVVEQSEHQKGAPELK